jgi:hypothetical protein
VPWCSTCDRFLSPSTVDANGTCPICGHPVDAGHAHHAPLTNPTPPTGPEADTDEPLDPVPWHFKLMLGALAIYLGYRALQGVEWVVQHL